MSRSAAEKNVWTISREKAGKIGAVVVSMPEGISSKATGEIDVIVLFISLEFEYLISYITDP